MAAFQQLVYCYNKQVISLAVNYVNNVENARDEYQKVEHEILGSYILNDGGEQIELKTVNSNIEIKKLKRERSFH